MDDWRRTWPGNSPGLPPTSPPGRRALALFVEGSEIILQEGELILGRSPSCDVVIDDMLASRVHAKISILDGAVVVRDLSSSNGVYVNSTRIDMPTALRDGDRLLIGTKELSVFAVKAPPGMAPTSGTHRLRPVSANRPSSGQITEVRSSVPISTAPSSIPGPRANRILQDSHSMLRTEKTDAFVQLGLLATRMMESGRIDGAIRVLAEHMRDVMDGATEGRPVPEEVVSSASHFALAFAEAKLESKWVDYVVELHMHAGRPMRAELIDRLIVLRRKNVGWDRDMMLFYKAALQREESSFAFSERVLCGRIFSLGDDD